MNIIILTCTVDASCWRGQH